MPRKIILLADNDPYFLATRAEFLEREGYEILSAGSAAEAERLLRDARLHLAILDVRLTNDDDEKDISGLLLAQNKNFRNVPKIILTGFPSPYTSRDALRSNAFGFQPAVNYIGKAEGPATLIAAVEDAFAHQVRINWESVIDWEARDVFSLVKSIEADLREELLLNRAGEFEDLIRRVFYEKEYVRIKRLLWERGGRIAIVVFVFKERNKPESFVIVCGQNDVMNKEAYRFQEFAPDAPGATGTRLSAKAETIHFAANAYSFVEVDLENSQTFSELYSFASPKVFTDALTLLCQKTLFEWHQEKPIKEQRSLDHLYRERLRLPNEALSRAYFEQVIEAIEEQIPTLGLRIRHSGKKVILEFKGQSLSYPDPLKILQQPFLPTSSTLAINVPGTLTGENILADETGKAWLSDFADAGMAPLFWNHVALEAIIRFDWVQSSDLLRLQEMEYSLINSDFARPDVRDLEPKLRKPARMISHLRKLAAGIVGRDVQDYHLGIFFQAARRLADHNPASPLLSGELIRLAHIWLAMAMISEKLISEKDSTLSDAKKQVSRLRIHDEAARIIVVGNQELRLAPQPFALLKYLFQKANQVCTKEELLTQALESKYDESYLHTLIMRIRNVIEEDLEQPRYLITVPNAGYRLNPNPRSLK